MFENPLVRVNIILSNYFKFYQTIFCISLEQVQGMEASVAALLPPSHQLQQLPVHQLPHLYLHTAPHHHLHPIHTGKSVINGRTHTIVLGLIRWRLFAKTDIVSALVKAITMTLACVSCFLMISTNRLQKADAHMSAEDVQRRQDRDITTSHSQKGLALCIVAYSWPFSTLLIILKRSALVLFKQRFSLLLCLLKKKVCRIWSLYLWRRFQNVLFRTPLIFSKRGHIFLKTKTLMETAVV